ncbi:MAG TPA: CBS domain-containing protein [Planctomycetota bacterium]|nr:CBS domain-containing protein [Planctomycetota bacterium]
MRRQLVTVGPDTVAADVARVLDDEGVSGVPVVDAKGRLLGIVSQSDLARAVAEETEEATTLASPAEPLEETDAEEDEEHRLDLEPDIASPPNVSAVTARSMMSENVVSVREDDTAGEIAARMLGQGIHRVVVLRDRTVVGIVSATDLLHALGRYEAALRRSSRGLRGSSGGLRGSYDGS